jgi:hypothetical protein
MVGALVPLANAEGLDDIGRVASRVEVLQSHDDGAFFCAGAAYREGVVEKF